MTLAGKVNEAYRSLSLVEMVVEALPITVLCLVLTKWSYSRVNVVPNLRRQVRDVVSYSVGLQFSLIFTASIVAMIMPAVNLSHSTEVAVGVLGWLFVFFVLMMPAIVMASFIGSAAATKFRQRLLIVGIALFISSGLVLTGVILSLLKIAVSSS